MTTERETSVQQNLRTRLTRMGVVIVVMIAAISALPTHASAAITQVYPAVDQEMDALNLHPTVAFTPAKDEKPKWVLLASDPEMTQTVRFCRDFFAAAISPTPVGVPSPVPTWYYACNSWATGTDAYGQDQIKNLVWGKTYYWQVIYTDAADTEQKSAVRMFKIKEWEESPDPSTIGTGSGGLNPGPAAFALSGVKIPAIGSKRVKPNRFRISLNYEGSIDLNKSYILVTGRGVLSGTRKLKLTTWGPHRLKAIWVRSSFETRLPVAQYSYQAFLVSTKNNATVKSAVRMVVIKGKKRRR